jgi:pimeloyl-ACP methyl ester carboxylesterase
MADVVARGVRLHVHGIAGPPAEPNERHTVVFIHGLVMDNLSSWFFTLAAPAARIAHVLLYDLRGHGLSERPASGYRIRDHIDDLDVLLGALGIERNIHLVGNSIGGLIALAFAASHPSRVASVALIDAHTGAAGFGEEMAKTLSLEGEERDRQIAASFARWLGRHSARKRTRLAENASALVYGTSLVEDLREGAELDDSTLRAIAAPVLALYGEHSDVRARGERIAAKLPRCEIEIIPGCTHSVLWEATGPVRDRVLRWISERVRRAG